jgi:hypothetical protein
MRGLVANIVFSRIKLINFFHAFNFLELAKLPTFLARNVISKS